MIIYDIFPSFPYTHQYLLLNALIKKKNIQKVLNIFLFFRAHYFSLRRQLLFFENINFVQLYYFVLKVSLISSYSKIPGIFVLHLLRDNLPLINNLLYSRMPGNHMTTGLIGESTILDLHMEKKQLIN